MPHRAHAILSMLIAVLAAAWFSPCCCQSAWMAEQAAQLLTANGAEDDACGCCSAKQAVHRECCAIPSGGKGGKVCKQSVGKMLMAKSGAEVAPTHQYLVWIFQPVIPAAGTTQRAPLARASSSAPPPECTLLGLACALTV